MKAILLLGLFTTFSSFAGTTVECFQDCPEGQICESSGVRFSANPEEIGDITGLNGEILSHKITSHKLKVKLRPSYGPVRSFSIDLRKIGTDSPAGKVSVLKIFRFNVFCEMI